MSSTPQNIKELRDVSQKVTIVTITHEITDYVPVYPLSNKLKFFDCYKCGKQDKKMFRLNLRNKNLTGRFNRLKGTLEVHQSVIYICPFCFDVNFSRFEQMIDDCNNDRFDKYEFAKN